MRNFYPDQRDEYEAEFIIPAKAFPEFTRAEIEVFAQAFREYDLDGSNSIDVVELERAFNLMGQGSSRERLQNIIDQVDADGTGEIKWPAYLQVMRIIYPEKREEFEKQFYGPARLFPEFSREDIDVFVNTFRTFDIDGSNTIDATELALMFHHMGQGCTEERLHEIIEEVDDNRNGVIDWIEFLEVMKGLYPERKAVEQKPSKSSTSAPKNQQTSSTSTSSSSKPSATNSNASPRSSEKPSSSSSSSSPSSNPPAKGSNKCNSCGKTVYPAEALQAMNVVWHKGCFKCQQEGCGITLNLKTFKGHEGKIYCSKHVPTYKATPINNI